MNMKNRLTVLLSLLLGAIYTLPGQSLLQEHKTITVQTGFFYTAYNSVFDMDGERKYAPSTLHGGFYAEGAAGIRPRLTALFSVPLLIHNSVEGETDVPGNYTKDKSVTRPGDIEIGARYGINQSGPFTASFTLFQSLGTGSRDKGEFGEVLNTGFADFNTRAYFDLLFKLRNTWHVKLQMGLNNRNKGFSDEFHAGALLHIDVMKNIGLDLFGNGIFPFENTKFEPKIYQLGLFHNNYGILNAGATVKWQREKGVGCFGGIAVPIKGQFIYDTPVLRAGVILRFGAGTGETPSLEGAGDTGK